MENLTFNNGHVNVAALDGELRAAVQGVAGLSWDRANGELTVHVTDGVDAGALRPMIEAVVRAHDPAVPTPGQAAEAARAEAIEALKTADVTAIRTGLEAKGATVTQLQAQVAALAAVVEQMRTALGLAPDGGRG